MKSKRNALVAQLVEQRTENPRVTGSIPVQGIFYTHGQHIFQTEAQSRGENKKQA